MSSFLIESVNKCETTFVQKTDDLESCQAACRELGNILQGIGRFDEAIVWHSFALDREPDLVDVYAQIGRLYAQESVWEDAVGAFNRALEQKPDATYIYSNLAQIYGHLGQKQAEIEAWYKALEADPELINAQGYYKLGKAFEQAGKMEQALVCLQRACDRSEDLLPAHYDLGEIWLRQGKLDLAKARYQKIIQQDEQQAKAHYKLGNVLLRERDHQAAIAEFRQTITLAPEFPWAYRDLVKTFLQLKQWDEAISTCYAIINLVEEYPWIYVQLGDALKEKGRMRDAIDNYKKACVLRGWQQCGDRDYEFTRDTFSYRLAIWQPLVEPLIGKSELRFLELGSYQGMSSCWFLDTVLTSAEAELVCVEPQFEAKLEKNIQATGVASKAKLLKGTIEQMITDLRPESFDLINLQDKRKSAEIAESNANAAWKLLKVGGLLIFNDYGWHNPAAPQFNPKAGIDRFLGSIGESWQRVKYSPQSFQYIIKKIA